MKGWWKKHWPTIWRVGVNILVAPLGLPDPVAYPPDPVPPSERRTKDDPFQQGPA